MNTGNWKTATNGRDNKRRSKVQKQQSAADDSINKNSDRSNETKHENQPPIPFGEQNDVLGQTKSCSLEVPQGLRSNESPAKQSWAEMSEPADVSATIETFNQEMSKKCTSMTERLAFISSGVVELLNLGLRTIQQERVRIGKSENEKNMVRDLHEICATGKALVTTTSTVAKTISSTIDSYEVEKNRALDELKNFLATIDTESQTTKDHPLAGQKKVLPGRYATAVNQDGVRTGHSAQNVVQRPTDMVSIPLGNGNLSVPLARHPADVQPMTIKFISDLGVFLINLDGKVYSFCDGTFIQRAPKSGDNTLFGKRCNPNIAHCVGATCTYYHDPLVHANGHTSRNMGVHYVVSELIGGVSTNKEIIETARGRNLYIVEDLVQLAGMLLIKAVMVKKMRESFRDH